MSDITTEAVRLSLGIRDLQARVASGNIANAGQAGSLTQRIDFASAQGLLAEAVRAGNSDESVSARLQAAASTIEATPVLSTGESVRLDEQVGDMTAASLGYQALSEALSRHFGLMRLAVTGRS